MVDCSRILCMKISLEALFQIPYAVRLTNRLRSPIRIVEMSRKLGELMFFCGNFIGHDLCRMVAFGNYSSVISACVGCASHVLISCISCYDYK